MSSFFRYYIHKLYHETLKNVTPTDMCYGRQELILKQREVINKESLKRQKKYF